MHPLSFRAAKRLGICFPSPPPRLLAIQIGATVHRARFLRTRQNELTPNHPNITVKQMAATTRPTPVWAARYFANSCVAATAPLAAISRKTSPIISSHNSCSARPTDRPTVITALFAAFSPRLRFTWSVATRDATRATTPNFCAVETLLTPRILQPCTLQCRNQQPRSKASAHPAGQADFAAQLESLWSEHNTSTDGTTRVEGEYLEVKAFRA